MVLKSLEMQGFKSFPDKTVLTFDKGMTAVVGPNGSGKSNISDAVRWVLGEQSTKNLRGAKMEDVIFSGTDKRRATGFAEVTLRLDNRDRTLKRDDDEVAVTRRYYRSGESEYKINGNTARLRDINELFMDTGLGRDGYSIVSQGKVADMVSAKSSQRRDMLEEAAGISHFRYRRADALRRLSQAEDNLVRLRDILGELESRVGPLKTQSEKAQKFLVLSEEKKQLEIGLWLYKIDNTKNSLKEQEHKIDLATAQYNGAEQSLEKIEADIEAAMEQSRNITLQIEEIRGRVSKREEAAAELQSKLAVAENTIALNLQSVERIQRDMELSNEAKAEVEQNILAVEEEIRTLKAAVAEKQAETGALEQSAEALSESGSSAMEETESLQAALQEIATALSDNRVAVTAALSSVEEIQDRLQNSEAAAEESAALVQKLEADREEVVSRVTLAKEALTSLQNSIQGYELRARNRAERAEKAKEKADALRRETEQQEDRIRNLEDLEKNMEGYAGSVKAVVREAGRGTLRGIHGPLSQLISVPDEYATAVETALGASVQHVVVDTEADAKRAISYLKESRGGRATFLPVSAIRDKDLKESGLDDCYGYIDLASNLVKTDKKYEEIVKAQLGRTVVAEDMDSAIAMGKRYQNRFRIVTLDGQVINAGGSMTGGSRVRNAGILSRAGEIEKLKQAAKALQEQLQAALSDYKKAEQDASAAAAEKEAAAADLIAANEEKLMADNALALVEGQLETVTASKDSLLSEREQGQARIAELNKAMEAYAAEEQDLLERQAKTEASLAEHTGNLEDIRKQQEAATEARMELHLAILSLEKDVEAREGTIAQLKESAHSTEDRDAEREAEIKAFLSANEKTEEEMHRLKEEAETLKAYSAEAAKEIDALAEDRNEAEAESTKLRVLERNKNEEREKLSGELARLEERKANMLRDYEDTINKLYEEYQLTRREAALLSAPTENATESNRKLSEVKQNIKALGSVNVGAIEEYKEVSERYEFMSAQITDTEVSKRELETLISELTQNMAQQFSLQFRRINQAFGTTFRELFGGGRAELLLEDESDILESPIQIQVQPPGKNVQNIDLLSGGEKGLSAIALLCAILKVTPAPFCIFDEVEAALDDVNVQRFAQYIRRMTGEIQFILITHRRGTMEEADIMYGITMEEEGVSKLLELKTAALVKELGLKD